MIATCATSPVSIDVMVAVRTEGWHCGPDLCETGGTEDMASTFARDTAWRENKIQRPGSRVLHLPPYLMLVHVQSPGYIHNVHEVNRRCSPALLHGPPRIVRRLR